MTAQYPPRPPKSGKTPAPSPIAPRPGRPKTKTFGGRHNPGANGKKLPAGY